MFWSKFFKKDIINLLIIISIQKDLYENCENWTIKP